MANDVATGTLKYCIFQHRKQFLTLSCEYLVVCSRPEGHCASLDPLTVAGCVFLTCGFTGLLG